MIVTRGEVTGTDEAAGEPEPYPIGFVRRLGMRRLGRQDGRRGIPDPMSEHPPLTTQARKALELDFIDAARGLRVQHLRSTEELRRSLRTLEARLEILEAAAATADSELERIQDNPPHQVTPIRRAGEADQPIELIRDRRDREHRRAVAAARQRKEQADQELTEAGQQRAGAMAELADRWERVEVQVGRLHATLLRTRAIYDHALLRRHPLHELVRPVLDDTAPPLPDWPSDPEWPRDPERRSDPERRRNSTDGDGEK